MNENSVKGVGPGHRRPSFRMASAAWSAMSPPRRSGKVNQAAGQAQELYGDTVDSVRDFASEQPVVALLSAMAVGVVLGFVLGRR